MVQLDPHPLIPRCEHHRLDRAAEIGDADDAVRLALSYNLICEASTAATASSGPLRATSAAERRPDR